MFTFEFGGSKKVVISGYEPLRELFVKNGDYSSNRSPANFLSRDTQEKVKKTPGLWTNYFALSIALPLGLYFYHPTVSLGHQVPL